MIHAVVVYRDVSRLASNSLKINESRKEKCVEFGHHVFFMPCLTVAWLSSMSPWTQDTSPLNYITQRFKNGYDEDDQSAACVFFSIVGDATNCAIEQKQSNGNPSSTSEAVGFWDEETSILETSNAINWRSLFTKHENTDYLGCVFRSLVATCCCLAFAESLTRPPTIAITTSVPVHIYSYIFIHLHIYIYIYLYIYTYVCISPFVPPSAIP